MTLKEAKLKVWPMIVERSKFHVRAATDQNCKYRVDGNPDNLAPKNCCFAGVLITPDVYRMAISGPTSVLVESVINNTVPFNMLCESQEITFGDKQERIHFATWMRQVQNIHDNSKPADWQEMLEPLSPLHEDY